MTETDMYSEGTKPVNSRNVVKAHQLQQGTMLQDRYRIDSVLGQGGFGITYSGYDTRLKIDVAIKEYYPTGYAQRTVGVSNSVTIINKDQIEFIKNGKEKFLKEAKVLAKFQQYPGIVSVRDFFEENETAYIIMELLEGVDLKHRIKKELYKPDEIFSLLEPIFDALIQVHSQGVIHRDISPDNILILNDGSAKLMDFGAARLTNMDDQRSMSIVLKGGYAPEEQYRNKGIQGPWTDVYALCATIYKCITGKTPDDSLERLQNDELKKPSELGIEIDLQLEKALMKGLAVRADNRFKSVDDFRKAVHGEHIEEDDEDDEDDDEDDDEATVALSTGGVGGTEAGNTGYSDKKEDDKSNNKKNNVSKRIIIGIAVALVLIVGVIALIGRRIGSSVSDNVTVTEDKPDSYGEIIATGEDNTAVEDNHSDMYEIILTPSSDITLRGFEDASKKIESRLEALVCGEDFECTVEGMEIKVYLPKSAFITQDDMITLMQWYVTGPFECKGIYRTYSEDGNVDTSDGIDDLASVVESMELKKGSIPDLDVNAVLDSEEIFYEGEDYSYIEITFTEEFWDTYGDGLENGGGGFDLISYQYFENAFSALEYHSVCVKDRVVDIYEEYSIEREITGGVPNSISALYHNLNAESIDSRFALYSPWVDIAWEENDSDMSGNQCPIDEMGEDYVILKFHTDTYITEGQLLDLQSTVKYRLDCIGDAYAYGRGINNINIDMPDADIYDNNIYVALKPQYAGDIVVSYITANYLYPKIATGLIEGSADLSELSINVDKDSPCIEFEPRSSRSPQIEYFTKYVLEQGKDTIYLQLDDQDTVFVKAVITEPVTDGKIRFDRLVHETEGDWQWKLIEAALDADHGLSSTEESVRLIYDGSQFSCYDGEMTIDSVGAKSIVNLKKIENEIQNEICNTATVSYSARDEDELVNGDTSAIQIDLNIAVDDDFAVKAVEMSQKVLEKINAWDYPTINSVTIVMTPLDEMTAEQGKVYWYRYSGTTWFSDMGDDLSYENYLQDITARIEEKELGNAINVNIKNGRFDKYNAELKKLLQENEYFRNHTVYFNGER